MQERNPLLEQENYFEGYNESINKLKNDPKVLEFDKLCYELFENNQAGKRFIELVTERYLLAPSGMPGSPTYQNEVMWAEGVRYAFLLLRNGVMSHKQRIVAQGVK
jgi:hypothetical protein